MVFVISFLLVLDFFCSSIGVMLCVIFLIKVCICCIVCDWLVSCFRVGGGMVLGVVFGWVVGVVMVGVCGVGLWFSVVVIMRWNCCRFIGLVR